jgi:uncharacterized protein YecE (DUF72 family)
MADHPDYLADVPVTADFLYIRRHGKEGNATTSYSMDSLKEDAKFIKTHAKQKKDVYLYLNNDALGYAPKNAAEIISLLDKKKR